MIDRLFYVCFQTTSVKSPNPKETHSLTSVTFNGKELVRYDYDDYGRITVERDSLERESRQ